MLQLIDPVTGAPRPAEGSNGAVALSLPSNGEVITPSDFATYDPPLMVWVGDTGPVDVAVVPYGRGGDRVVTYPVSFNMAIPVLCKQVLATGTTAVTLRTGAVLWYVPRGGNGPPPLDMGITTDAGDQITTDAGDDIITSN